MRRRLSNLIALGFVSIFVLGAFGMSIEKHDTAVPVVLNQRASDLNARMEQISINYSALYEKRRDVQNEHDWQVGLLRFKIADIKIALAQIETSECELLSQGSFCDIASSDLDQALEQIKFLEADYVQLSAVKI